MLFEADGKLIFYSDDRNEWRHWLEPTKHPAKQTNGTKRNSIANLTPIIRLGVIPITAM